MTFDETMAALEAAGSEQTRKTYRRHGIPDPMFGVSFATLGTMTKRIKRDHDLALKLWATGNADARTLATFVADPAQADAAMLDAWVQAAGHQSLAAAVADLAVKTPAPQAKALAERWIADPKETVQRGGWALVSVLALADNAIPQAWFEGLLARVEAGIHASANWTKYGMNGAMIAIGTRDDALEAIALASAKRVGQVEVDHGDTACKTPLAEPYIVKARAHAREKAAKAAAKKKK